MALPPASSPSAASPLQPPEKTKPRQEELAGPERRPRWPSPRARVMTVSIAKLEDEAAEHQHAVENDAYSDFAASRPALFLFRNLPCQPPKETTLGSSRSQRRGRWGRQYHTKLR